MTENVCTQEHDRMVEVLVKLSPRFGAELLTSYGLPFCCHPTIATTTEPRFVSALSGRCSVPDLMFVVRSGITLSGFIEVKRTIYNLENASEQLERYLGATSCFFVAVPGSLLGAAVTRIHYPRETMPHKGLVNADNGQIVILPRCRNPDLTSELSSLNVFHRECGKRRNTGCIPMEIPLLPYDIHYSLVDGMMVREGYDSLVLHEMMAGYPLDDYIRMGMIGVGL